MDKYHEHPVAKSEVVRTIAPHKDWGSKDMAGRAYAGYVKHGVNKQKASTHPTKYYAKSALYRDMPGAYRGKHYE